MSLPTVTGVKTALVLGEQFGCGALGDAAVSLPLCPNASSFFSAYKSSWWKTIKRRTSPLTVEHSNKTCHLCLRFLFIQRFFVELNAVFFFKDCFYTLQKISQEDERGICIHILYTGLFVCCLFVTKSICR